MRKTVVFIMLIVLFNDVNAQNREEKIIAGNPGLHIGGYGQVDFNLPSRDGTIHKNGTLDVHRLVTFFGYNFNEKASFISEVEFEHVSEVYVEQAFLDYKIKNNLSVNAGLMLIPMGIQNLYHEPATFNGVERTNVDKYIVPSTWREIGIGVSGRSIEHSVNYQVMLVNGLNGYSDVGVFSGKSGLRSGRQKGAESYITYPDFAGSVKYKTSRAFTLPTCSGVYFIHDFRGIHYIGEAKNLQQRFLQHHTNEDNVILIELVRYPFGELRFYWLTTKTKPKAVKLQKYWIRVFQPISNKVKYIKDRS